MTRLVTLDLEEPKPAEASPPDDDDFHPFQMAAMQPRRRGGMLVSTLAHVAVIFLVIQTATVIAPPAPPAPAKPAEVAQRVFLPPTAVLRQMAPPRVAPRPAPVPVPTPAPDAKDRISIGPPSDVRQKELMLRREDDLTRVARGQSMNPGEARPRAPEPAPTPRAMADAGVPLTSGEAPLAPPQARLGRLRAPILASLDRLQRDPSHSAAFGVPTGAGGQMGPLFFDPQGADFTDWIQRFKNEVYRNWIVPPSAVFGFNGEVDFEFVVDRSGAIVDLRLLASSGTGAYDRAARNALTGSRFLPLPTDYRPETVTMKVGFIYNAGRQPPAGGGQ
jgi:TonB family protein